MASAVSTNRTPWLGPVGLDAQIVLGAAAFSWLWLLSGQDGLGHWPAMLLAMMLPALVPQIAYVRARSFAARKLRAALLFTLTYLLVWIAAGAVFALLLSPFLGAPVFAPLVCLLAAFWQLSPQKRRALNRCHRRPVLSAFGPAADRDVVAFGLSFGRTCLQTCLPMMLIMLAKHDLTTMFCLTVIMLSERAAHRPDPHGGAVVLGLLALVLALTTDATGHAFHVMDDVCVRAL